MLDELPSIGRATRLAPGGPIVGVADCVRRSLALESVRASLRGMSVVRGGEEKVAPLRIDPVGPVIPDPGTVAAVAVGEHPSPASRTRPPLPVEDDGEREGTVAAVAVQENSVARVSTHEVVKEAMGGPEPEWWTVAELAKETGLTKNQVGYVFNGGNARDFEHRRNPDDGRGRQYRLVTGSAGRTSGVAGTRTDAGSPTSPTSGHAALVATLKQAKSEIQAERERLDAALASIDAVIAMYERPGA